MYTIDEIEKILEKLKSVTIISIVLNAIRIQITEKQIRIAYYLQISKLIIHSKKCKISKPFN